MSSEAEIRKRKIYRVTFVGFVVNLVLSVLKLAAGIVGRSGAMVADAVHSFSDLATDVVVIAFAKISAKPRDDGHDYGHGKYETLATIIISLALAAVGAGILLSSIRAIRIVVDGGELPRPGAVALAAAVVSIVIKEILYRYTVREGCRVESPSMVANAWHHRSDALSSLGTLAGIGCAYFLGQRWRIADPIAALVVAVFIFKVAFDLIRTGLGELLERSLPDETEQEILGIVTADPEVGEPHNLRTRRRQHIAQTLKITAVHGGNTTQRGTRRKRQHGEKCAGALHQVRIKRCKTCHQQSTENADDRNHRQRRRFDLPHVTKMS